MHMMDHPSALSKRADEGHLPPYEINKDVLFLPIQSHLQSLALFIGDLSLPRTDEEDDQDGIDDKQETDESDEITFVCTHVGSSFSVQSQSSFHIVFIRV
jgi:hypothetical protein